MYSSLLRTHVSVYIWQISNTKNQLRFKLLYGIRAILSTTQSLVTTNSTYLFSSPFPKVSQYVSVKLTSSNYMLWKAQLLPLLNWYNLSSHVSESSTPPSPLLNDNTLNPEYQVWYWQDQLVLSWLFSTISENPLPQIIGSVTAKEA